MVVTAAAQRDRKADKEAEAVKRQFQETKITRRATRAALLFRLDEAVDFATRGAHENVVPVDCGAAQDFARYLVFPEQLSRRQIKPINIGVPAGDV